MEPVLLTENQNLPLSLVFLTSRTRASQPRITKNYLKSHFPFLRTADRSATDIELLTIIVSLHPLSLDLSFYWVA